MYFGKDLILVAGAPGSRWSAVCRALYSNLDINLSDHRPEYNYEKNLLANNKSKKFSSHLGAYWGPYHDQGHSFDQLDQMSKEDVVNEFKKPYKNWATGKKIIKSHWFSYHLPLLERMFPEATIVGVYRSTDECYDWWHKLGGWDITYPNYDWYIDNEKLKVQIEIENQHLKNYFNSFKKYQDINILFNDLKLTDKIRSIEEYVKIDKRFFDNRDITEDYRNLLNELICAGKFIGIKNDR
jgi:hypothetical protein